MRTGVPTLSVNARLLIALSVTGGAGGAGVLTTLSVAGGAGGAGVLTLTGLACVAGLRTGVAGRTGVKGLVYSTT